MLNHQHIDRATTVDVELRASNEIQQCVTIDAALARGVSAYDPAYSAPSIAAPLVNRLLRALFA